MSIKLLSAAWDLDIGSTEKMVLMCLCDFANEHGICWPSVATICRKTSKSERTVQSALKWLKDEGFYRLDGYHDKTPLYRLDPRKICTPAEIAPPQKLQNTPAKSAPKPLRTTKVDKANALPTKRARICAKPDDVSDELWADWLSHRDGKFSQTALEGFKREADKAGWTVAEAFTEAIERKWQGFKADWVKEKRNGTATSTSSPDRRSSLARAIDEGLGFLG